MQILLHAGATLSDRVYNKPELPNALALVVNSNGIEVRLRDKGFIFLCLNLKKRRNRFFCATLYICNNSGRLDTALLVLYNASNTAKTNEKNE